MSPLLNGVRNLTKNFTGKAEVLNAFFVSFITAKTGLQEAQATETKGKVWSKEDIPVVEVEQPRKHLNKLDIHKSVESDGLHPWILRELADAIARTFLIIFERLEQ